MSHSSSPTNRNSIFGWVKNLKRGNLMSNESVNEITSDNELTTESKSPSKSVSNSIQPQQSHSQSSQHQEFLRPLLHHKSRSTNNVNRVRSNSFNQSEKGTSIRQHRDSFLQHNPLVDENSKYFGVPLEDAIDQASANISILTNENVDHVLQYGKIPIVVAKCGVYLKKTGLTVEGIFRVGGSSKRLKELQLIFNSPPNFGKKLNWDGYTVHDAASILRRYLNALPEPLIPLDLYEQFRDPLRKRPRIINYMKYKAENPNKSLKTSTILNTNQSENNNIDLNNDSNNIPLTAFDTPMETLDSSNSQQLTEANIGSLNNLTSAISSQSYIHTTISPSHSLSDSSPIKQQPILEQTDGTTKKSYKKSKNYRKLTREVHEAIDEYKKMVDSLPNLSKQLLFYILDLLAMVQNNSNENLMSSRNLAAIFQPSILSHPNHDMDPIEYALSQFVVEFLIQYAYKLLPNQNGVSTGTSTPEIENPTQTSPSHELEQALSSTITSTSTTPLEEEAGSLLSKPPQPQYKRHHSKSLSSSTNHDDLVGYQNSVTSKSFPMIESDNYFEITDDDNDIENSDLDDININRLNLNQGVTNDEENSFCNQEPATSTLDSPPSSITANIPNVAIIVSTPTSSESNVNKD